MAPDLGDVVDLAIAVELVAEDVGQDDDPRPGGRQRVR
jgi:hypothetical protein